MGKRILLILVLMLTFAGYASAYSNPRWFTMPLTVYLPKQEESLAVTNAFKSWQVNSKSCVRFLYRNSKNLASISNINVSFVKNLPDGKLYMVTHRFANHGGCRACGERFYNNADIVIALQDKEGNKLTSKQLNAVALQAVGVVVGVELNSDPKSIMYSESKFNSSTITVDDIKAVNSVYKPNPKN